MYTAKLKSLFLGDEVTLAQTGNVTQGLDMDQQTPQAQPVSVTQETAGKHSFISKESLESPYFPTWCPGCGNFGVWTAFKNALAQLNMPEENVVIVYGVGCSGNMADFNRVYGFHALHGRAIPTAEGIKLANHKLKVIVVAGDGDTLGEGMNHFITACRGNHDITLLVHDNQVYGLTTGQASPTTEKGTKTKSTPSGTPEQPVNPLGLALTADATFVARGFANNIGHLTKLIKAAIQHEGFSLVDMFQPCFTFNHHNTYHYFKERVYDLNAQGHDPSDKFAAWQKTHEADKLPIGIFYQKEGELPLHKTYEQLQETALVDQSIQNIELGKILSSFS